MATDLTMPLTHPMTLELGGLDLTFRRMTADDRDRILTFTRSLPERDLLFLRLDITQESVVDFWLQNIERGKTITVLAELEGELIGYCSLHQSESLWTRHLGEIRLLVSSNHRGKGIGGELARQIFELAQPRGLLKLVVRMMSSQQDAQALFHGLGFIPEALLNDWTIDRNGRTHDLIVMSREIEENL
ncbi:MAG: GNAT family N-acetyltransferase [Acidobacteriota bacterium]